MSETATGEIDLSGDGGVLKKITHEGLGTETPLDGCTVSLHYTGKLTNGEVFDSSLKRNEPFEFQLGKGSVIKAFDLGVSTMKMGEKCVLTCAPQYAYGEAGSPPSIPPNSTLIFELEMLGWKGEDVSPESDGSIEKFVLNKSDKKISPNDGAHVKIHLIGKHEGKVFEERDVEFDTGEGEDVGVVEGVEIAVMKMNCGETCKLFIKPKYAFGSAGNAKFNIPPNAIVEYIVTLNECERAAAEWKLDREESIAQAKIFKEKGNTYLKKENYKLAIKMYDRSNNFLSSYSDEEEGKQMRVAIHLNKALSYQKLGDHFEAKSACNTVLEIDPNNIKGLYRRGQSYAAMSDFETALEDFQRVHELEPENKAAINQITICKQKIKEFHEKEKKVYANMFSKFAAVDKQ
ncbi:FK506-binding protein 59 isoform X2 [Hermetia illucens]|nr:FK506-binding protein 59 isoform X2 [Hermetia illucens]